jgi:hypothetical protein
VKACTRSSMLRRRSNRGQFGRFDPLPSGVGLARFRQRNMKTRPTPPSGEPPADRRPRGQLLGRSSIPRGRGPRGNDQPRPPSHLFLDWDARVGVSPRTRRTKQRGRLSAASQLLQSLAAIKPRSRGLDSSRRAGRPRSQGRQTRASSLPKWTALAPSTSSPSRSRWR